MRLDDIVGLVAQHGAEKYAEKRGYFRPGLMPVMVGTGMMLPTIGHKAHALKNETQQMLDLAAHQQLDENVALKHASDYWQPSHAGSAFSKGVGQFGASPLAALGNGLGHIFGNVIDRNMRDFGEMKDPLHMLGTSAVTAFGSGMGGAGADLLRDMASKAMASVSSIGNDSARQAIINQLKHEDPILSQADNKALMEAFHTMARFAPVLSTDKNAVRSFLRQAVMGGGGADYASIKLLADAEHSVTGRKKD